MNSMSSALSGRSGPARTLVHCVGQIPQAWLAIGEKGMHTLNFRTIASKGFRQVAGSDILSRKESDSFPDFKSGYYAKDYGTVQRAELVSSSPAQGMQCMALSNSFHFSDLTFHLSEMAKKFVLPVAWCCCEASRKV